MLLMTRTYDNKFHLLFVIKEDIRVSLQMQPSTSSNCQRSVSSKIAAELLMNILTCESFFNI